MKLRQYQVDAFSERLFGGNPAAVVLLDAWLPDALLQAIAEENRLSETAYCLRREAEVELRWFTPVAEVDLCGHATLAAAHVLFRHEGQEGASITFATRSGLLTVQRFGDDLEMSFPARVPVPCEAPALLVRALGVEPLEVLAADDYVAVYADEDTVRALAPDLGGLSALDRRGVVVTAPGNEVDFVSRFFAPKLGVPEDPVTGSAHCELAPFWGRRLNRTSLRAFQCSRRGGSLGCRLAGDRVLLTGRARTFMEAVIDVEPPHAALSP